MGVIGGADGTAAIYLGDESFGLLGSHIVSLAQLLVAMLMVSLLAYFLGNISPSTMLAKKAGIDIKKEGSGNAGTTNALRVLGKKAGLITAVVDILKGVVAALVGVICLGAVGGSLCALFVYLGHVWPMLYKFKGGKGVATAFGATVVVSPLIGLIALCVVAILVLISKRMSVGSIAGAVALPILAFFIKPDYFLAALIMGIILIVKHRANIGRLIRGEEPVMSIFVKGDKKA